MQERTADLARTNAALQAEIRVGVQQAEEQRIQLLAREQHARSLAETAEARYRNLFEGTAEAILTSMPEVALSTPTRAAIMMLGYSRDELLEMRGHDILAPSEDLPWDAEFLGAYYWRGEFEACCKGARPSPSRLRP